MKVHANPFPFHGISFIAMRAPWRGGLNGAGPFHALVGITRGGLVPAAIVAREIGMRR